MGIRASSFRLSLVLSIQTSYIVHTDFVGTRHVNI